MPIEALRSNLGTVKSGTRVSYEDMANSLRVGTVIEVMEGGGRWYRVQWEDSGETTSDLRQYGWNLIAGLADATTFYQGQKFDRDNSGPDGL